MYSENPGGWALVIPYGKSSRKCNKAKYNLIKQFSNRDGCCVKWMVTITKYRTMSDVPAQHGRLGNKYNNLDIKTPSSNLKICLLLGSLIINLQENTTLSYHCF
jgi:hypothetical protein